MGFSRDMVVATVRPIQTGVTIEALTKIVDSSLTDLLTAFKIFADKVNLPVSLLFQ